MTMELFFFLVLMLISLLTTDNINGRAVEVGRRVLLFVVLIESLALTILVVESKEVVCRLEFECFKVLRVVPLGVAVLEDVVSFSTFRRRSGMSIVFALLIVVRF